MTRLRYELEIDPPPPLALRAQPDLDVTFLPMETLGEDGRLDCSRTRPVSEVVAGYTYVADGDVLLAKVTPCFENGKAAVARELTNGVGFATTEVFTLRPGPRLDRKYLFYLIATPQFRDYGVARFTGAGGLKRVSRTDLLDFRLDLPDKQTQRQVARYLDRETAKIDALIRKQERLIETLRERRAALAGEVLFAGQACAAEPMRIKYLYESIDRRAFELTSTGSDELPLLSVSIHRGVQRRDATTDTLARAEDLSSYKTCEAGDLIINRMRAFQGAIGMATQAGLVSPDYLVVRSRAGVDPRWLTGVFRTPWFVGEMASRIRGIGSADLGAARTPRINADDLGQIRVSVPPEAAQAQLVGSFESQVSKIDTLIKRAQRFIELSKERRSVLISAAVTGQIDVSGEVDVDQVAEGVA